MSKPDPIADPHRLLTPAEAALVLRVARTTLPRLRRDEALPALVLGHGPGGREIVRYDSDAIQKWLDSRRERQVRATLDGHRFARRAEGSR